MLQLVWERDDWITLPAGTRHWFDMGTQPDFCALGFFNVPAGWEAEITSERIAEGLPLQEELQGDSREDPAGWARDRIL